MTKSHMKNLTIPEMLEWFERDHPDPGDDHYGDTMRATRDLIAKGLVVYDPFERRMTKDGESQGICCLVKTLN